MSRGIFATALATVLVLGCASQEERRSEEPVPSFFNAFTVLETRNGSRVPAAPRSTLVDYESGITLRPDRPALSRLVARGAEVDPALSREERAALDARMQAARQELAVCGELARVVDRIGAYEAASMAYYAALEQGTVKQEQPGFQDLAQRRGDIQEALATLARIHYETVVLQRPFDWDNAPEDPDSAEAEAFDRHGQERSRTYRLMAPDPVGSPSRFDAAQVTRLLNETTAALRACVDDFERAALEKAPKAVLEMEAELVRGKESLPVSIAPYTIVQGVERGRKSPRVGIPGEEDLRGLEESYAAYGELADALNGLKGTLADEETRRELVRTFLEELRKAAERVQERLLADLRAAADLEGPQFDAVRTAAAGLATELVRLEREIRELAAISSPIQLATRAVALLESLQGERGQRIETSLRALAAALADLPATLEGQARTLVERLEASARSELESFAGALEATPGGADVARLVRSIKALAELANARSFGEVEAGAITRTPFTIDAAEDGLVDLANTPAEPGDRLAVKYRVVVSPDAEASKRREYPASVWLDVRKFGLYTTLKSQLLFYDRLGDGASSYRAAPGLSYNFHYRPESAQAFFDTVSPGLGVSVSSPSFEEGAELAIGLQLTLFDDMLQAGYAYDVSVGEDHGMVFFGLDLIGAFQRAL